jgi:hypothetical protein
MHASLQKLVLGKKMVGRQLYGEIVSKEPQISFDGQGTCHVVFTLCEEVWADNRVQFQVLPLIRQAACV